MLMVASMETAMVIVVLGITADVRLQSAVAMLIQLLIATTQSFLTPMLLQHLGLRL
jgi:Mg/Co/Ni transporter MgtE